VSQPANLEAEINDFLAATPANVLDNPDKLARMQSLVDALGNPEKQLKVIHVAGTSGKTSVCYFAASLLKAAGYTTGLTVSPHVDTVRERAIVDLAPLSENDWAAHASEFFQIVKKTGIKPSYFEFYMGFAFWLFAKLEVDYAIIETGIGGTWDGSNVVQNQDKVCIITDIGYDHTEILGNDLATITIQKSGIIHAGNNVYAYPQSPEITSVIKKRTMHMHGKLHLIENVDKNFMVRNLNLAKHAVNFTLHRNGHPPLTTTQLQQAKTVLIPARAEPINYKNKQIIMDGSHNPQKLQAFTNYLNQKYPSTSRTLIATLGQNKSATLDESMLVLRAISDQIILTSFEDKTLETNNRISIDQKDLINAARRVGFQTIRYIHDPLTALKTATKEPATQIVVTGSFYTLNHLRPHLLSKSN
jgi:dihydrofolate synthase/folylpolyglutamate synthase